MRWTQARDAFWSEMVVWLVNIRRSPVWELKWKENCLSEGCSCSVSKPCLTLCDLMDCSTPGFPVFHYLPVSVQTHVHRVGDANQPSHPLSPPSPPALNLSQHQGFFQWVGSLHQLAKVLELQLQYQFFQCSGLISFRIDWFDLLAFQRILKNLPQHHNLKT